MVTSAARNENRLSDDDRAAIITRVRSTLRHWHEHQQRPSFTADASLALQRSGAHAIGCSLDDLRDSERQEICELIDRAHTQVLAEVSR